MVRLTWQEGDSAAESFTLTDEVLGSLEKFRNSPRMTSGKGPIHATVREMLFTPAIELIIRPALEAFPTPDIVVLKAQAEAAQKALTDAHTAALGKEG